MLRRSKKILLVAAAIVVACAQLVVFGPAPAAKAATPEGWVNRTTINLGGKIYIDSDTYDRIREFQGPAETDGCPPDKLTFIPAGLEERTQITPFYYDNGAGRDLASRATYTMYEKVTRDLATQCIERQTQVTIPNFDNRRITFYEEGNQIIGILSAAVFQRTGDVAGSPRFVLNGDGEGCKDVIVRREADPLQDRFFGGGVIGGSSTLYAVHNSPLTPKSAETYRNVSGGYTDTCYINYDGDGKYTDIFESGFGLTAAGADDGGGILVAGGLAANGVPQSAGNENDDAFIVFVGNADNKTPTSNPGGGGPVGNPNACPIPGKTHLPKTDPNCNSTAPLTCTTSTGLAGALAWIICPIADIIAKATDFVEKTFILPYLTVSPLTTDRSDTRYIVYQIWDGFRSVANVMFVIAFFMIIFSQATSVGISNYGIKKLLPKIILVAILSNLSFFVVAFLIDVFNIIGQGIATIITNTVLLGQMRSDPAIAEAYGVTLDSPNAWQYIFVLGGGLLASIALTGGGVLTALIGLMLIAVLIIFVAVVCLIIRQLLIIVLVVISPLAFVAWLLPNTERYFSRWFSMLIQQLALYPIIVLLFAAGKIAGVFLAGPPGGP